MHLYHNVLDIETSNNKIVDELIVLIDLTIEIKHYKIEATTIVYVFNMMTMLLQ